MYLGQLHSTGPIRPDQVANMKAKVIPEMVFTVVNQLIALNFTAGSATIGQREIVNKLTDLAPGEFKISWLNFEEAYRDAGWEVEYDKPGYNESYEPTFTFKPKK